MLRDILEGKESSKIVLIRDSIQQSGRGLLKAFISSLTSRVDRIHLILYDIGVKDYMKGLTEETKAKIHCHDGTGDPAGWFSTTQSVSTAKNVHGHLLNHVRKEDCRVAVVIDSLSQLILRSSSSYTCSTLHQLTSEPLSAGCETVQLLALVHEDLHDELILAQLQHIASSVLTISTAKLKGYHAGCEILHSRTSGKIFRMKEHFLLGDKFFLEDTEEIRDIRDLKGPDTSTLDPTANLTFKLSLKESEKEARSQLHLPYMHHEKHNTNLDASAPGGKIFYQPDKDDDFDEEDPDDDLDI